MANKCTGVCVALILILASASGARRHLNTISELIDYYQSDHTNIIELLYWFAQTVNIHGNNVRLTFDPDSDYGSHHYGNFEGLLDFTWEDKYYTVGNIRKDTSGQLPSYVVNSPRANNGWNKARIIIRVRGGNAAYQSQRIIDRVFITQHYGASDDQGTEYDPDRTYEVSTGLLRELRATNRNEHQRLAERSQRGNMGYIEQSQRYSFNDRYTYTANNTRATNDDDFLCRGCLIILCIICFIFVLPFFFLGNMKK